MHPTERADRLQQLKEELNAARRAVADYDALAIEAKALAAERLTEYGRFAMTSQHIRYRGQAMAWQRRVMELTNEIAALESGPAAVAVPVVLSDDEVRGMDEMAGVAA